MASAPKLDISPGDLKIVLDILARHVPDREVWAFGSRATWKTKDYSDLDLAIIGDEALPLKLSAALSDDFAESDLPFKVDVVDWATTSESFREIIKRDRVVVRESVKSVTIRGFRSDTVFAWPLVKMEEVVTLHYGKALIDSKRRPGCIPVYGTNGRTGWHDMHLGTGPTVILGRKGMGNLGVEWCPNPFWVIDTAYYTSFSKMIEPKFFYYFTRFVGLNHLKDGTSNPSLSRDTFSRQLIPLPSLNEQSGIVSILGALDDKIDLNRRMNETLEAMARALFKSWFVDFDPVRAKMEGSRPDGMDEETARLFPDSLDGFGLPTSWGVKRLEALTSELRRGTSPSYVEGAGVLVVNQKCIRGRAVDTSPARRHDQGKKSVEGRYIQLGDILVNSTGVGTLGRVAQVWHILEPMIVDSHVTIVRADPAKISPLYLGVCLTGREVEIEGLGEGSTGQTELSRARLGALDVIVPSSAALAAFDRSCSPLIKKMAENTCQSRTLAALRDLLLPRLLSGQLRLKDAEKMVADAV